MLHCKESFLITMVQAEAQFKPPSGKVHLHKGFVKRWEAICNGAYFEKMRAALTCSERVVMTGHSLGGAVAILATLWYLQNRCARCVSHRHAEKQGLDGCTSVQESIVFSALHLLSRLTDNVKSALPSIKHAGLD